MGKKMAGKPLPDSVRMVNPSSTMLRMVELTAKALGRMPEDERRNEVLRLKAEFLHLNTTNLKSALKYAFRKNLLTKAEYERDFKGRYVRDGLDSFADLLLSYINFRDDSRKAVFVTTNELVIADGKRLKERFGMDVMNPEQANRLLEKSYGKLPKPSAFDKAFDEYDGDKGFGA
jgi:hypothetical protein